MIRSASCSAGCLDDPLGGVPADPDDRVDRRAVRREIENALEEPAGVPGAGGALAQRHPFGHLDDAERRQLAGPWIEHRGPEADQLLGGHRVGDRDEDPGRERSANAHDARPLFSVRAFPRPVAAGREDGPAASLPWAEPSVGRVDGAGGGAAATASFQRSTGRA